MAAVVCYILAIVLFLLASFGLTAIGAHVATVPLGLAFFAAGALFGGGKLNLS